MTDGLRAGDFGREFREAVERARTLAVADGELHPANGPFESPLPPQVREKLEEILHDGTYDRAVADVIAEDPELA
jgi:hypothetical protein